MKPVPGICDRCGLRYKLSSLKFEYVMGRSTGRRVCKSCYDPSHPQLDTRNVRTDDKQSVRDSRSDIPELEASRRVFGFWPWVGQPLTSTAKTASGYVRVVTNND